MKGNTEQPPNHLTFDETSVHQIHAVIIAWFAENGRDLPWRKTRDPYCVLVSEVMLQQIQVVRAIPFYEAFIARFPTIHDLAAAPLAAVIQVWGDLGRYRRIVYLHRAAKEIVERFGGIVPRDAETLRSLPGIGPYTAGAVACFAYEQDVGFVDTNVRRVLGRIVFGHDAEGVSERELAVLAQRFVPSERGWEWNQGLLDFGALHCTARKPKCGPCPLAAHCAAYPVPDAASKRAPSFNPPAQKFEESNRYFRGRVLAALRDDHADETSDGVPLSSLGKQLKPTFSDDDVPWLYGVVAGLQKDGLAAIAEETPAYDVGRAPAADVIIRLP